MVLRVIALCMPMEKTTAYLTTGQADVHLSVMDNISRPPPFFTNLAYVNNCSKPSNQPRTFPLITFPILTLVERQWLLCTFLLERSHTMERLNTRKRRNTGNLCIYSANVPTTTPLFNNLLVHIIPPVVHAYNSYQIATNYKSRSPVCTFPCLEMDFQV